MSQLNNIPLILSNFNIWICYNRHSKTSLENIDETVSEFTKATSGKNKNCNCKIFKGRAVNDIWKDWHCIYCLKPIKNLKNYGATAK